MALLVGDWGGKRDKHITVAPDATGTQLTMRIHDISGRFSAMLWMTTSEKSTLTKLVYLSEQEGTVTLPVSDMAGPRKQCNIWWRLQPPEHVHTHPSSNMSAETAVFGGWGRHTQHDREGTWELGKEG